MSRYTKPQKLAAVLAAEIGGVVQAQDQTGIPESTIRYWLDQPEFAQFRAMAREEMADEIKVVAHLAWRRVAETLPSMDPRDAIFAAEKATSLLQLVTGEATARTETREITEGMSDHERDALRDAIDEWLAGRAGTAAPVAEEATG